MGIYSKFQNAKISGGGFRYPKAGDHLVKVTSVKMGASRKGVEFFAVECQVLHTTSTDQEMSPGNRIDWSTHADKDPYEGNVLGFISAAYGMSENEIKGMPGDDFQRAMEMLVGEDQAASGKILKMVCVERVSKAGNNYVAVRWESVDEATSGKWSGVDPVNAAAPF